MKPQRESIPPELPGIGIATLVECSETSISETDAGWCMSNLKFKGLHGSPDQAKLWMYIPVFFHNSFHGSAKEKFFRDNTVYHPFVYTSNIMSYGKDTAKVTSPSLMECIAGEFEGEVINDLWDRMNKVCEVEWDDDKWAAGRTLAELTDAINGFIEGNQGIKVGYIRTQRRNEVTKAIEQGYQVDRFFIYSKENMEYYITRANPEGWPNAKGKLMPCKYNLLFDEEIPF